MYENNVFDMYEKFEPKKVVVETPKEDKLFDLPKETMTEQKVSLPDGFEENLISKITESIMSQINTLKGEAKDGLE